MRRGNLIREVEIATEINRAEQQEEEIRSVLVMLVSKTEIAEAEEETDEKFFRRVRRERKSTPVNYR